MSRVIKKLLLEALSTYPDNSALSISGEEYSYQQFLSPVIALIKSIQNSLESQQVIGVLANKSLLGFQCIATAFIAEKTYVPLNPQYPVERNAEIIKQSGITTLLVDASCKTTALAINDYLQKSIELIILDSSKSEGIKYDHNPVEQKNKVQVISQPIEPDTAYLLFTSGSTGKPKGVPISDNNIASYIDHILQEYQFVEKDRFSQFFDFTFDLSLHDMLICWKVGACLCPVNKSGLLMPLQFARQQSISIWFSVPSLALIAKDLMRHRFKKFKLDKIRYSFFCGEALPVQLAQDWLQITQNAPVINLYGPTEATIAFTAYEFQSNIEAQNSVVEIGLPFGENKCQIMQADGKQCTTGEQGELCLNGPQVFVGYLNREDLTSAAFHIEKQSNGQLIDWYRTGDTASQLEDGNIIYHGRKDRQVQVKGFRVELQEVEHILRKITSVGTLAVIAYPLNSIGEAVGLTALTSKSDIDEEKLLTECKKYLPNYMIPGQFISIKKFPYNVSGKLDYKQLQKIAEDQ